MCTMVTAAIAAYLIVLLGVLRLPDNDLEDE